MEALKVLRTAEEIQALRKTLAEYEFIALDTETTGLEKSSIVIGYSVSWDIGQAAYVILAYWDPEQQKLIHLDNKEEALALLRDLLPKKIIGHNILFDVWMIKNNFGIDFLPSVHTDTMILAHLMDENRQVGLKELAVAIFGEDSKAEQTAMKESVTKNGGLLTKSQFELYKGDADLIAYYGARDAELTLRLFYHLIPQLYEEGLDQFFYEDESMPLLRSATYELNYCGMKVDVAYLNKLKAELEAEILEAQTFIDQEVASLVKEEYPGTSKKTTFNIGSGQQLAWLLFKKLGNTFVTLTDRGRAICQRLEMKVPYANVAKREWLRSIDSLQGRVYMGAELNPKTKKMGKPKKIGVPWKYMSTDEAALSKFSDKYRWVAKLLKMKKNEKLLSTYVLGIQDRLKYGVIYPSFLQHGTTSGRYSSRGPNFQNLPRDDKRIKKCIVPRPGKVFVGADQSQLEPRVFASQSGDERLCASFSSGDDFYSVVGVPIFAPGESVSLKKADENSFAKLYPEARQISKEDVALATPYGTTAWTMSQSTGKTPDECQEIIDSYFDSFPSVFNMMIDSHKQAMEKGFVTNLFGRPRRLPEATRLRLIYGKASTSYPYKGLPYVARSVLNLSMNHRIQSTGSSIMNRIAIRICAKKAELALIDPRWKEVFIVIQVHDSLVLEGPEALRAEMMTLLQDAMENTVELPLVKLEAVPKAGYNLSEV